MKEFVPWRRAAYRVAAIALFRALLAQSRAAPVSGHERTQLQNVVRHSFKARRLNQTKADLNNSFNAGYEALDLLDAAVAGNADSLTKIQNALSLIPQSMKDPPPLADLLPKPKTPKPAPPTYQRKPEDSVLARPRPVVPGIRRVPVLASAGGIPFLRFKKPQPESLSVYLRSRLARRHKRTEQWQAVTARMPLCEQEDAWDEVLAGEVGVEPASGSWTDEQAAAGREFQAAFAVEKRKNVDMIFKMADIVEQERELADAEQVERRRKRAERRSEKRKKWEARQDSLHEDTESK